MNSDDLRKGLLDELKIVEKLVRADLLAQYRANPDLMARAMQRLREEENSPSDSAAWLETFAGRRAVLYILKTLYLRVLEDQGLLRPIRLRDGGTYETFRSLFPQLGHAAYLRWIFADAERALPELFVDAVIEIATPGPDAATAVWNVWQLPAAGGGPRFDFSGALETRFIGDLYQDLDNDVRERYALYQTPRFIESFILDQTLEPALTRFGLKDFKIIDPTCGSGHFLLGAYERIAHLWRNEEPDTSEGRWTASVRALESIYGTDINEYATSLSRLRLILAVVRDTGVVDLERLRALHLNILTCDSLIPWESFRDMLPATAVADERFRNYGSTQERSANAIFLANDFHAVVGNPPYIFVDDERKRSAYRAAWPRSAQGLYSQSAPMTERFWLLPTRGGFSGFIVAKNFTNREFGKGVVENVVRDVKINLVVDTSGASLPGHATPTLMIFSERNKPVSPDSTTTIIASTRGGPSNMSDPGSGIVWTSILHNFDNAGFENGWISVRTVPQSTLEYHPWTLSSATADRILLSINKYAPLTDFGAKSGFMLITKESEAFERRYSRSLPFKPLVGGTEIRDWQLAGAKHILFPYDAEGLLKDRRDADLDLWALRTSLFGRSTFEGTFRSSGREYYEFGQISQTRIASASGLVVFAEINSNSQFILNNGVSLFDRSAPVLELPEFSIKQRKDVVAFLNSSTIEFWFKSRCAIKNGWGETWQFQYVRNATNVLEARLPIQDKCDPIAVRRYQLVELLEIAADAYQRSAPSNILKTLELDKQSLGLARSKHAELEAELISLQEELDWNVYGAFGLLDNIPMMDLTQSVGVARGHRPFEIALARRMERGEEQSTWFTRHKLTPTISIPEKYCDPQRSVLQQRVEIIEQNIAIGLLEQPVNKRRWNFESWDKSFTEAVATHILDSLEEILRDTQDALTIAELATHFAKTPRNVTIAALAKNRDEITLDDIAGRLLETESIPDNPARFLSPSGLAKLVGSKTAGLGELDCAPSAEPFASGEPVDWKRVWRLQEREDANYIVEIKVPPTFSASDYAHPNGWRIRGKFNIANERFIVYDELSPKRYAWGGRTIPERARLSAEAFDLRGRQVEAAGAEPASVQPTRESPARCGIQFPLWDKVDELRRLGDPNYGDVRELAMLCGRACPCDVLEHWRAQARPARARRAAAVMPEAPATSRTSAEELDPSLLERLIAAIRRTGDTGAPTATLEPLTAGNRRLLTRALERLRTSGLIEPTGRGRGVRYRLPANRLL